MKFKGPPLFYVDFISFPVLAMITLVGWCRSLDWVPLIVFGLLLFSFAEYWVHRIGLHVFFYHGAHQKHHIYPSGYTVFPIWYSPFAAVVLWLIFPLPIFVGLILGFVWFIYWHHVLHHFNLANFNLTRKYAIWHLRHHRLDTCNYGITLPIWDYMFGTFEKQKTGE